MENVPGKSIYEMLKGRKDRKLSEAECKPIIR
jgi:hypothetical protein